MAELCFENVTVGYAGKALVSNISFSLKKGEITALAGPNGAGKSTILKTASGLLKPVKGRVCIGDRDLNTLPLDELAKTMSVMLTERINTEYMTVYDVVRVGRYQYTDMFGTLKQDDRRIIEESMKRIGVWDLKDADFSKLSDGQKQRVLLARAIVSEPEILILDEPTSFLDMGYKVDFFDILKDLAKSRDVAMLISMHEMELVKKVADRVICISGDRRIDKIGKPEDILSADYLESLFSMKCGKYEEYYGKD